jgi:hypothetical protein
MVNLEIIRCSTPGCYRGLTQTMSRRQLIENARDFGWTFSEDGSLAWCPDHSPTSADEQVWVVGCYTCGFEEEYDDEEDAKYEHSHHECKADTYLWTPETVLARELRRGVYRHNRFSEEEQDRASFDAAMAEQERIYRYATNWLRIRNVFLFWKKRHIR